MNYKHTQKSQLLYWIILFILGIFLFIFYESGFQILVLTLMIFVLAIIISLSTLTVSLDDKYLKLQFGAGIFIKKFRFDEINSVTAVKNKWYYGWGIRVWFWPYMIIYNTSGFDAIEIILKDKKRVRIGTDDVKNLEKAVQEKIQK